MLKRQKQQEPTHKDRRLPATVAIVFGTVFVMACCIPMVVFGTKDATLPIWALGASALATAAVWLFGEPPRPKAPKVPDYSEKIAELEKAIEDLEERLESVEVMNRFESAMAEKAFEAQAEGERTMGGNSAETETA